MTELAASPEDVRESSELDADDVPDESEDGSPEGEGASGAVQPEEFPRQQRLPGLQTAPIPRPTGGPAPLPAPTPPSRGSVSGPPVEALELDGDEMFLEGEAQPELAWSLALFDGQVVRGPFALCWEDGAPKVRVWYASPGKQGGFVSAGYAMTFRPEADIDVVRAALGDGVYIAETRAIGGGILSRKVFRIGAPQRGPVYEPPPAPRAGRAAKAATDPATERLLEELKALRTKDEQREKADQARKDAELREMRRELQRLQSGAAPRAPRSALDALEEDLADEEKRQRQRQKLRMRYSKLLGMAESKEARGEKGLVGEFKNLWGKLVDGEEFSEFIDDMSGAAGDDDGEE